ncbi:hypothetical protein N0V90_007188 [Kalmusia sp. IMI 367209]|nr:hypothetical protein N0V90_007188 [Kalmusia sp. IMI 367209]
MSLTVTGMFVPMITATSVFLNTTTISTSAPATTVPPIPHITFPPLPPSFDDIPLENLACYDSSASAEAINAFIERQPWLASWSSANEVPLPSCKAAENDKPLCYRLHSAYSWRTSAIEATGTSNGTTSTITIPPYMLDAARPNCHTLQNTPPPDLATKSCIIGATGYEVHYWPSAPLPGSSFCANGTRLPGGTPTIPGVPNTAVVSGLTLTSPSVYHFLKGAAVSTSIGGSVTGRHVHPVYSASSSYPSGAILTLPQDESAVWTAQPLHKGVGLHARWEWSFANGSYNADAMTQAPAPAYFEACKREREWECVRPDPDKPRTISQAHYRQYAAVSIRDVLDEWDSDAFKDCIWHQYWELGDWYGREDMWIAPGEPAVAKAIVTEDGDGDDHRAQATSVGY